uniref:Uncharacterized protein n=1 Tax=Fagus sylvatica TaxID=28930 RepID=A0A2N9GKB7_FAGSY
MRQPNGWLGSGSAKEERRGCCCEGVGRAGADRNMGEGDRWRERRGFLGDRSGDRQRETQDSHEDEEREASVAFGFGRKAEREREKEASM